MKVEKEIVKVEEDFVRVEEEIVEFEEVFGRKKKERMEV